jgi:hypothetical protein
LVFLAFLDHEHSFTVKEYINLKNDSLRHFSKFSGKSDTSEALSFTSLQAKTAMILPPIELVVMNSKLE